MAVAIPSSSPGDQVAMEASILAVADVFNGLSSVKTSRVAMPEKAARIHLVQHAGLLYDPAVVEALFKVIKGIESN